VCVCVGVRVCVCACVCVCVCACGRESCSNLLKCQASCFVTEPVHVLPDTVIPRHDPERIIDSLFWLQKC
jgi:hypothetical protein